MPPALSRFSYLATILLLAGINPGCTRPSALRVAVPVEDQRPRSNILRQDYAGSGACAGCHPAIYQAWQRSPMHNMTRLPGGAQVRAPFDGREVRFKADSA